MKKTMLTLICVLLCMFAFTAGVSAETLQALPAFDGVVTSSDGVSVFSDEDAKNQLNFSTNLTAGTISATQSNWGGKYLFVSVGSYGANQAALPDGTKVTYQWYSSTDDVVDENDTKLRTGSGYSVSYKDYGIKYYYVVASATIDGVEYTGTSNIVCVKVGAQGATVALTVNNKGVIAADKNGAAVSSVSVTVADTNYDGKLTYDEALIAAHNKLMTAGDYATTQTEYGLQVTKFWGVETSNLMFYINGSDPVNNVGEVTVAAKNQLYASINKDDKYYSDKFAAFDVSAKAITKGLDFELTLKDIDGNVLPGMTIGTWEDGKFAPLEGKTTDENGKVSLCFEEAGTYIVSATGTIHATIPDYTATPDENWNYPTIEYDCPIMAPACTVSVKEYGELKFNSSFPESTFNVKVGEPLGIDSLLSARYYIGSSVDSSVQSTVSWYRINAKGNGVAEPVDDITAVATEDDIGTWQYYIYAECEAYGIKYDVRSNFANVVITEATAIEGNAENGFVSDIVCRSGGYGLDIDFSADKTDYEITEYDTGTNDTIQIDVTVGGLWYGYRINGIKYIPSDTFDAMNARDRKIIVTSVPQITIPAIFNAGSTNVVTVLIGTKYDSDGNGTITYQDDFDKCDAYNFTVTTIPSLASLTLTDAENVNIALDKSIGSNGYCGASDISGMTSSDTVKLSASFKSDTGVKLYVGETAYSENISALELNLADYKDENGIANIPLKTSYINEAGDKFEHSYTIHLNPEPPVADFEGPVIKTQPATETSAAKDTTVALTVEAEQPEKGTLSYQWLKVSYAGATTGTVIEGATSATFDAPTGNFATTKYYKCQISLTIDGATATTLSDAAAVTTELTYPLAPEFTIQPGIAALKDGSGAYKKEYTAGNKFDTMFFGIACADYMTNRVIVEPGCNDIEIQCYYNTSATTEGGTPISGTFQKNTSGGTFGSFLSFTPDTNLPEGEWYVYFVATSSVKDGSSKSEPAVSDFIKLTFVPAEFDFDGGGFESDPFLLKTGDDFVALRQLVEQGNTLSGMYFKMTNDITLPADWESMGSNGPGGKYFGGIIDGGGYKLSFAKGSEPLIHHAQNAEIKNLKIYGEEIQGPALISSSWINQTNGAWIAKISNVTLVSGTSTLMSGLVNGSVSTYNPIHISNCTAEEGVVIGYDKSNSTIGTFAGGFIGTIQNCSSSATVYGKGNVGGLIGAAGNAMGASSFTNCYFTGKIEATGGNIGGIMGAGYNSNTAPNGLCVSFQNCYVNAEISGKTNVGGFLGADAGIQQSWSSSYIRNNVFYGTLTGEKNVGGMVGYYAALNKYNVIEGNYFYDTNGCTNAIGGVEHIDTSAREFGMGEDGIFYYDTSEDDLGEIKNFVDSEDIGTADWQYTSVAKINHNRTDDPMGADKYNLGKPCTAEEMTDGTVLDLLNASEYGMQNWIQGENGPIINDEPVITTLELSGDYKKEYYIGDEFDTTGMVFTATYSDESTKVIPTEEITISGFDASERALLTLTASYGAIHTTFEVKVVIKPVSNNITVYFTLLGDDVHDENTTEQHTLVAGNLKTWVERTEVEVDINATVKDVLIKVLKANGMTHKEKEDGNYISAIITADGVVLAEFTNGTDSGWQYTLNGKHPDLGVKEQFLENGDEIVFHYTDNYTIEESSPGYIDPAPAKAVSEQIAAIGEVTLERSAAIRAARDAYDALSEEEQAWVTNYEVLTAAEATLAELKKAVDEDVYNAEVLIDAIGEVTLESKAAIDAARAAYDALSDEQKALVENADKLTASEATYAELKAAVDKAEAERKAVEEVEALINAIGTVTKDSKDALDAARSAYNKLSADQKELVENAQVLFDAEDAYAELIKPVELPFTDIEEGYWGSEAIAFAYNNGIMNGTADDTFAPEATLNRAMYITMIYRLEGEPIVSSSLAYTDVPSGQWYSNAIIWGTDNGIIQGYGNGIFGPFDSVSRQEMAAMMYRYAVYKNADVSKTTSLDQFSDSASVSDWAVTYMSWAVAEGLFKGDTQGTLRPTDDSSRAEAATVIMRYADIVK